MLCKLFLYNKKYYANLNFRHKKIWNIVDKFKAKHSHFSSKGSTMQTFLVNFKVLCNFFYVCCAYLGL